jgi:hypothetical protein
LIKGRSTGRGRGGSCRVRLKIISWLKRFLWTLIEQHLSNQKTIRHVKQSHSIGVADDIGHLASLVTSS